MITNLNKGYTASNFPAPYYSFVAQKKKKIGKTRLFLSKLEFFFPRQCKEEYLRKEIFISQKLFIISL